MTDDELDVLQAALKFGEKGFDLKSLENEVFKSAVRKVLTGDPEKYREQFENYHRARFKAASLSDSIPNRNVMGDRVWDKLWDESEEKIKKEMGLE